MYRIRKPQLSPALGSVLRADKVDTCVASGTRLREGASDTRRFEVPTEIEFVKEHCGDTAFGRMRWGVTIMSRTDAVRTDKIPKIKLVECSSGPVHFDNQRIRALKTEGIYISPPAAQRLRPDRLIALTNESSFEKIRGRGIGHIICGDFNTKSWGALSRGWVGDNGIWDQVHFGVVALWMGYYFCRRVKSWSPFSVILLVRSWVGG